jgi:hypothetical protein
MCEGVKRNNMKRGALFAVALAAAVFALHSSSNSTPPESPVDVYQRSWEKKVLGQQRSLELNLPLKDSTFLHTHNTYNSAAYSSGVSYIDPNQNYSINDQLRMDIRAVEFDVHWYFWMDTWKAWEWGYRPLLCHGQDNHIGCSAFDKDFQDAVGELNSFIRSNRSEVVILYIEEHLDGHYQEVVNRIKNTIGDLVYRPSYGCQDVPVNITRQQVLNAGKNIILWSGSCGAGEWQSFVYVKNNVIPEENVSKFNSYPDCASQYMSADTYANKMVRFYEDQTNLTRLFGGGSGSTTTGNIPNMLKCGVNLVGMDKLSPTDGRLNSAVYSWNPGEPNDWGGNEDCAQQYSNGRWNDANCGISMRFACRNAAGQWKISNGSGVWTSGAAICSNETGGAYQFAVPKNSQQNQKLVEAKNAVGVSDVWIKYSDRSSEGNWTE